MNIEQKLDLATRYISNKKFFQPKMFLRNYLGCNPRMIDSIKKRLQEQIHESPLFNCNLYTQNFEEGISIALSRFHNQLPIDDIYVV